MAGGWECCASQNSNPSQTRPPLLQHPQLPEDPNEQLRLAICAVFRSWNIPRAVKYRTINRITGLKGTAVNVQSMVYGNLNDDSCTGVCFTRNAGNGTKELYGEFLINAQGEDVVAGIRTPLPIVEMGKAFPEAYADLLANTQLLENHMKDMQDCEFTVQDKQLYMLQVRATFALRVICKLFCATTTTTTHCV